MDLNFNICYLCDPEKSHENPLTKVQNLSLCDPDWLYTPMYLCPFKNKFSLKR